MSSLFMISQGDVGRKAILVFADQLGIDLAKRRLPGALRGLFGLSAVDAAATGAVADIHLFTSGSVVARGRLNEHLQHGATFAERLENAIERIAMLGYDEIVMIGRDCPRLDGQDIRAAFARLSDHRLVLGPDHRGGCYLIALRTPDRHLLRGIRWKRNTDFAQLRATCPPEQVTVLAIKHDLDSWADLRLIARGGDRIAEFASAILRTMCAATSPVEYFVSFAARHARIFGQMPPPASA